MADRGAVIEILDYTGDPDGPGPLCPFHTGRVLIDGHDVGYIATSPVVTITDDAAVTVTLVLQPSRVVIRQE